MAADGTLLSMTVAPGPGGLQPIVLRAVEKISEPFLFEIDMVAPKGDIDPDKLLHQPICVTLTQDTMAPRHFHGLVRSCSAGEMHGAAFRYCAEVVPRLWFTRQTADCRIFHQLSGAAIIEKILSENGITAVQVKVQGDKPVREFTVQYNETDLQFISRLMQEEGYYYFHTHKADDHTLVIANKNVSFDPIPQPKMQIREEGSGEGITAWRELRRTAHGKYQVLDYDPLNPSDPVAGAQSTVLTTAGAALRDHTIWPALTVKADAATAFARRRQEAAEAYAVRHEGASRNPGFVPGGRFTLAESPIAPGDGGDYGIQSVVHHAIDEVHANTGTSSQYTNSFIAFPIATEWRQPFTVPRPRMEGVFNAIVLGKPGEEIAVDEHYRIRVRFFWDHRADATADNTILVRIMQPWAGKGWGMQHVPRVGTEVAMAFVNGDPDHPICLGCLYNGENKAPFPLPAEKTKSGIRTRSSLKGGTADFNEFFFDDKKGNELVSLHAQKDHVVVVENDQATHVMHDQALQVDNCRIKHVKKDETVTIDGKQTSTIKLDRTTEISKGNEALTVKMGNMDTKVSMGNQSTEISMGNQDTQVKLGNITVKASVGSVTIEAMQAITLKVGGSSVKIDQMGVTIKGMMVKIDGGIMTEVKGLMTKVDGSAMTMVKGGITMIG